MRSTHRKSAGSWDGNRTSRSKRGWLRPSTGTSNTSRGGEESSAGNTNSIIKGCMKYANREEVFAPTADSPVRWIALVRIVLLWIAIASYIVSSQTKRTQSKPSEFELPLEEEKSALSVIQPPGIARSEERRVGKECRSR